MIKKYPMLYDHSTMALIIIVDTNIPLIIFTLDFLCVLKSF